MNEALNTPNESPAPIPLVEQLLSHYGSSHRHPTNELIHFIAIPAIMLSLIGLIFAAHPWAAYAFIFASMVYYVRIKLPALLMTSMVIVSLLMLTAVHAMGSSVLKISVATFVIAWIFQFIGHKIEGKKPSFFEDIQYLWVGPLFVLAKLYAKLGIKS